MLSGVYFRHKWSGKYSHKVSQSGLVSSKVSQSGLVSRDHVTLTPPTNHRHPRPRPGCTDSIRGQRY